MATIKNEAAQAAKELKKELTAKFPNVKFKVKSSVYSGGNSIDIDWSFGPSIKQVQELSARRQHGKFDGMTDSYTCTGAGLQVTTEGLKEVASAKYVSEHRNTTRMEDYATRPDVLKIYAQIGEMFGYVQKSTGDWEPETWNGVAETATNRYYRILQECTFVSDTVELLEVQWIENAGINPFTIIYKDLNTNQVLNAREI